MAVRARQGPPAGATRALDAAVGVLLAVFLLGSTAGGRHGGHAFSARTAATELTANIHVALGQTVGVSFTGTSITPGLRHLIVDDKIGSVTLLRGNFTDAEGLRSLDDQLESLGREANLPAPLLVNLDEEGGTANRVPDPLNPLPSAQSMALLGPGGVRGAYAGAAHRLQLLGVGLNLAPVADLRTNPGDTVILSRSFGSNPNVVAPLISAAVQGMHDGGVGATVKHFPGLGGAVGDPHIDIPTDTVSASTWWQTQARTFGAGIAAGSDAVMTTAVYVPSLDASGLPAVLSPNIVTGLLRQQLGYNGVIVTDSLSMGGLGKHYSLAQTAIMALQAGNDLLLLGNGDTNLESAVFDQLRGALDNGSIDANQVVNSAARVDALRWRYVSRVPTWHWPNLVGDSPLNGAPMPVSLWPGHVEVGSRVVSAPGLVWPWPYRRLLALNWR